MSNTSGLNAKLRLLTIVLLALMPAVARGQIEFKSPPIDYGRTPANDAIARLQQQLDAGTAALEYDDQHGYLPALLKRLQIKPSSQVLVYSKTSFQLRKITPRHPRALYFNDTSYIGWVQGGDVIEVMSTDPVQGEVFYTLAQDKAVRPEFIRDRGQCIVCHASSRTQGVPGALVRSAFVDSGGQPQYGAGTFTIDHRSPFDQRRGGWYVTGTHGKLRHMGNVLSNDRQHPEVIDREDGANVTDLATRFKSSAYLTPHSDIVALMVLEHQSQMQNLLTLASYEDRLANHHNRAINKALERPEDYVSESTQRRIASVGDKLLRYLLFCEEFMLTDRVRGTSGFAEDFQALGPRDKQGRSLRDFDLERRIFKYPCSYLIYSPAFEQLPAGVKQYVAGRLKNVLTGQDQHEDFKHLSAADRQAILEILTDTLPNLWN